MKTVKMKTTVIVPTDGSGPDLVYQEGLEYSVPDDFAAAYESRVDLVSEPEAPKQAPKG